ncbi:MAG: hypothetical protein ACLRP3_09970 [Escherichia sp.]
MPWIINPTTAPVLYRGGNKGDGLSYAPDEPNVPSPVTHRSGGAHTFETSKPLPVVASFAKLAGGTS